jgi:phospholipase/lecithinase/hemolysin
VAVWLALSCGAAAGPAAASQYSGFYVFGDSLSDVGNVFLGTGGTIPGSPYFAGRFSNGPNWADDLSARLGLGAVVPSLAGGTDFAFGGAVTGPAVPGASTLVPNIVQQVGLFTLATGGHAPSSGLYAVWIGANDIFTALDDLLASTLTLPQAQADLALAAQTAAGAIAALATEGARNFLVPLIPDLGKTPNGSDFPGLAPVARALTQGYNTALVADIGALTAGTGASVEYLDTFGLIDAAVADPAAFGFTNVTDRCYIGPLTGGGSVCATPNSYLFWDGQHGTATSQALVAQAAAAVLPEPPAVAVLLGAILALLGLRARSSRWRA